MRLSSRLLLSLILFLLVPAIAQEQRKSPAKEVDSTQSKQKRESQQGNDVVRLSVTLVQVDAVVTDKKGKYVSDLKPEDFEILEDGKPQQISNFSYVNAQPDLAAQPTTPSTPINKNAPPVPAAPLRPEEVRRTIALVVDDLSLSFESTHFVREALKEFVDKQMQPGDLVAIIRTGAGMGALQQFTSDKRLLRAAIDRVRWNMIGRGGVSAFAPISSNSIDNTSQESANTALSGGDTDEELANFREEIFTVGTLGALNFITRGLMDLPGRKSIILLSDGFRLFNNDNENYRVIEALRRLTDLANRASVVIYTIDARGLQPLSFSAADDVSGMSTEQMDTALDSRRNEFFETQQGLDYLASETGGFFIRNNNDLAWGINRALEDQKGYYLIGYIPEESTFQSKNKFHQIKVRVKRAGLKVRSRAGFYGITDEEARPAPRKPGEQLMAALASPFASGDMHLQLTSLFGHNSKTGAFMRSMLHIEGRDIAFKEEEDGWHKCTLDLLAYTFGDNGQVIDRESRTFNVRVRKEAYEKVKQHGLIYNAIVPIKKPGAYQLRVAVRDEASERVGSANQFIEVPDLGKKRLTLSGILLSGKNATASRPENPAQEKNASSARPDADKEGEQTDEDPEASSAVRRLHRGMLMDYAFVIYNAQLDRQSKMPQLEARVMLFRDGKQVYGGDQKPVGIGKVENLKRIVAGGRLRLGVGLAPGQYAFQVVVIDKLAKEKYSVASQWIDFEIVNDK